MERRYQVRLDQLLADCEVPADAFGGLVARLESFTEPFLQSLTPASQGHGRTYLAGLLSNIGRKNTESIAYRHDQDRQSLQRFVGYLEWDHRPLLDELTRQVAATIGEADAVIVFDPSGFAKRGPASVGVQRQWCGRLGKTENCQVGIYMGYVARTEQVLVDQRLYLPKEWCADRKRRQACGVPKDMVHQTRHELALAMLAERGAKLPHAWVAGDDEMGRPAWFREKLNEIGERYLLAVPSNTSLRDLEPVVPPPVVTGPGRGQRCGPRKSPFVPVRDWCETQPESAWTSLTIREADKGPLDVQALSRRVESKIDRRAVGFAERLFVVRSKTSDGWKYDYHLSNAPAGTPLAEFARVANAEHRIEQCLQRGKSEAGLADSQTRRWEGWYHHQTLSLLAVWFLIRETRRGKKNHPGVDRAAGAGSVGDDPTSRVPVRHARTNHADQYPTIATQRTGPILSLQKTQPLTATEVGTVMVS